VPRIAATASRMRRSTLRHHHPVLGVSGGVAVKVPQPRNTLTKKSKQY